MCVCLQHCNRGSLSGLIVAEGYPEIFQMMFTLGDLHQSWTLHSYLPTQAGSLLPKHIYSSHHGTLQRGAFPPLASGSHLPTI